MINKEIFIPGKLTEYLFSIFLVIALIISLVSMPFGSLLSTNPEDIEFKIGYPMTFFKVSTQNPEKLPLDFLGLIVDFLIYFLMGYAIEVLFNLIKNKSNKRIKNIPENKIELIRRGKKAYEY